MMLDSGVPCPDVIDIKSIKRILYMAESRSVPTFCPEKYAQEIQAGLTLERPALRVRASIQPIAGVHLRFLCVGTRGHGAEGSVICRSVHDEKRSVVQGRAGAGPG